MSLFLSQNNLPLVHESVARPRYDRSAVGIGIVHFGPGAFHRVHQAWFVESVLAEGDLRWGICGVSLRNPDVRDALAPQDCLYTLAVCDEPGAYQIIGSLREILVAPENPERVLQRLVSPHTHVVTITVTEKGYCLSGKDLDLAHRDIQHDIENPHAPVSVIGYLVEGLRRRRAAGLGALTVISCDNLVDNGERLRRAVAQLAATRDRDLAEWIRENVAFPRTMVDSITPATTDAVRQRVAEATGLQDRWPVQREAFVQWVLEDRSAGPMPDLTRAGVTITDDVPAYDRAKLRLLNGAHSTLAYVGSLAGFQTVSQAMTDPELAAFVRTLMIEDIMPSVQAPRGLDLRAYIEAILKRFRNSAIRHELAQIAWDGSQKLPFRIFGTIRDALGAGRPIDRLAVPIAAWMQFVRRAALENRRVNDPLAEPLLEIGRACEGRAASDVPGFLALRAMFPDDLASEPRFQKAIERAYDAFGTGAVAAPTPIREALRAMT
ncbi:MAG TPA: mannitol dehydrogenase family protein [Steroidobacteraceae bacterium]